MSHCHSSMGSNDLICKKAKEVLHRLTNVLSVMECECVCGFLYYRVRTFLESEDILAGPHFFNGLFDGYDLV